MFECLNDVCLTTCEQYPWSPEEGIECQGIKIAGGYEPQSEPEASGRTVRVLYH